MVSEAKNGAKASRQTQPQPIPTLEEIVVTARKPPDKKCPQGYWPVWGIDDVPICASDSRDSNCVSPEVFVEKPSGATFCSLPDENNWQTTEDFAKKYGPQNVNEKPTNDASDACIEVSGLHGGDYSKYSNRTSTDIEALLDNEQCGRAANAATECCQNPAACLTSNSMGSSSSNSDTEGNSGSGAGAALMGFILQTYASAPGSISDMCKRMKNAGNATSTLQATMAAQCETRVRQCKSSCQTGYQQAQQDLQSINNAVVTTLACRQLKQRVQNVIEAYDSKMSDCGSANNSAFAQTQQIVASQMATQFASQCAEQASAQAQQDQWGNPDCNLATNISSPFCQSKCSRPGAASDPSCAAYIAGNQNHNSTGGFGGGADARGGQTPDFSGLDSPEAPQGVVEANIMPQAQGLDKVEGATGAGSLGSGSSAAGSSGGGSGARNLASTGYDTNISNGLRSGGGYNSGGGYSSPSGTKAIGDYGPNAKSRGFNLNKYLPGGDPRVQRNSFRGIASQYQGIGSRSMDIFEMVSNRYFQVCLSDRLKDCSTLLKSKRKGK